ncbi:MAG: UPF0280 family protein [Deltaproteobacteria bacterium]|nr:UPF0280 family protein [Deltaproteobacteria bacterium]
MQQAEQTKPAHKDQPYRRRVQSGNLVSFRVLIKETDLMVSAAGDLSAHTRDMVHTLRRQLEDYIRSNPGFQTSLLPYPEDPFAPQIVKEMISAARMFNVGPMAAVAGTIADFVGKGLLNYTDEVIVENGGDIFLKTSVPTTVSVYAGDSPLSNKLGLITDPIQMPLGICTSSATVGHSLSLGIADAVCVVARSASVADAAATALGNRIRNRGALKVEIEAVKKSEAIKGGMVITGKTMATWGEIELTGIG